LIKACFVIADYMILFARTLRLPWVFNEQGGGGMKQEGMKQGFRRADRVSKEIKEIVAILFSRYATEANLSFVTITNVSLSNDLKSARIFYSIFPGVDRKLVEEAIDRSQGWVRRELSRQIQMKSVPRIQFFPQDESVELPELPNPFDLS